MDNSECCIIFDSVAHPEERQGEEYAKNLIAYRRFKEAEQFDPSQGTHVLIIDGKIDGYGPGKEYRELVSKHPQALYAPLIEKVVRARFSSIEDGIKKEWQVCVCTISPIIMKITSLKIAFAKTSGAHAD